MDYRRILRAKRDGGSLDGAEVEDLFAAYLAGDVPESLVSALLMAIYLRGMEPDELVGWTRGMLLGSPVLAWPDDGRPVLDKHSTGGIGDKASLPLAPALAACGARVPMISGRGLGHTGGTLDKLEAVPGLRTALSLDELQRQVGAIGCGIAAQTAELVPVDGRLYALRDATDLVESIPLIASSILSKKICEGLDALVLDVKFGSGAFLPDAAEGQLLAETMLGLARGFGLRAVARMSSMESPLGAAVGHSLEIAESIECLQGRGPGDLRELVLALGGDLLCAGGMSATPGEGESRVAAALDDGSAAEAFRAMLAAQGGDGGVVDAPGSLPRASKVAPFVSPGSGVLGFADCRNVGYAVAALGGGRVAAGGPIDPRVGVIWRRSAGDAVQAGDVLAEVHHETKGLEQAQVLLEGAVLLDGPPPAPLLGKRLS